jgi:hypothetical protein
LRTQPKSSRQLTSDHRPDAAEIADVLGAILDYEKRAHARKSDVVLVAVEIDDVTSADVRDELCRRDEPKRRHVTAAKHPRPYVAEPVDAAKLRRRA